MSFWEEREQERQENERVEKEERRQRKLEERRGWERRAMWMRINFWCLSAGIAASIWSSPSEWRGPLIALALIAGAMLVAISHDLSFIHTLLLKGLDREKD